jgi:hypothetical protein
VVWFGNLPPPLILPPPIRIINAGGRLSGGARLPNQTQPNIFNQEKLILKEEKRIFKQEKRMLEQ